MLGNPRASLLVKHMPIWTAEALPCVDNSLATCLPISQLLLRSLLYACLKTRRTSRQTRRMTYLSPFVLLQTSPWTPPPRMSHHSNPSTLLATYSPTHNQFVCKYIYYNWPRIGWCVGLIKEGNSDPSVRVRGRVANFEGFYDCDGTTVTHLVSPS